MNKIVIGWINDGRTSLLLLAKWQEIPGKLAGFFQTILSYPAQGAIGDAQIGGDLF